MSNTTDVRTGRPGAAVSAEVREHRVWFVLLGVAMMLLGIAALAFPFLSTLAIELLVGWILMLTGVVGLVHAFRAARWKGFALSLLWALLSLGVGIALLVYPFTGMASLTLLVGAFFLAGGILRIIQAMRLRPADYWGWLLTSGILALLLGGLILAQWPMAATWVLGVLVGIDLIFAGWTAAILGVAAGRVV